MPYLLFPLASAILYAIGNLFLKQAISEGGGLVRSLFVSNIVLSLGFMPLAFALKEAPDWNHWMWPVLTGCVYFLGQLFTIIAIQSGDVSVQTPLMGMKLIFVAAFSAMIRPDDVPPLLWAGAAICTVGIFLIGGGNVRAFRRSGRTVILTLIACVFFAATDTLSGYRSEDFGQIPFILLMAAVVMALSLCLLPFFRTPLYNTPPRALKLMGIGSAAIGLQAFILILALTSYGQPTAINIVYSSRAIFGVLLVIFVAARLGNLEARSAGPKVMRNRLLGALLLCVAIAMVFI